MNKLQKWLRSCFQKILTQFTPTLEILPKWIRRFRFLITGTRMATAGQELIKQVFYGQINLPIFFTSVSFEF